MTHAQAVTGIGGTTAGATTQIGADITLPAGGPWTIFGIWGQVAKLTTQSDQGTGGRLLIEAVSGDLTPNPAPGRFPLIGAAISQSVNAAISANPLQIWPVNWTAPGKSVIRLSYVQQLAINSGSQVLAGILYGTEIPTMEPILFCDSVESSFSEATEQTIGSITLSEKATQITGILADCNKGDAATIAEAIAATIRLSSNSAELIPLVLPCNRVFNAGDGTVAGQPTTPMSAFIPVNIPVIGGAIIDIFATSTQDVTANIDLQVFLAYK